MSNTGGSLPCESDSSYDSDAPSPPPYQERPPPPYRASNDTLPRQDTYQPPTRDKNFHYPNPEAPSESTPLVSSSSFEDKAVRRGFVRKVGAPPPDSTVLEADRKVTSPFRFASFHFCDFSPSRDKHEALVFSLVGLTSLSLSGWCSSTWLLQPAFPANPCKAIQDGFYLKITFYAY